MAVGERPGEGPGEDAHDDHPDDAFEGGSASANRPSGPPPDPLDRLWVHPTELGAVRPSNAPVPAPAPAPRRRVGAWIAPLAAGAAGALVTVGVLAGTGTLDRSSPSSGHAASTTVTTSALSSPNAAATVAQLGASVVAISVHDASGVRRGSGVCIRHGGGVLTTIDVVGTATTVDVETSDGSRHAARVVGRDRVTDLALLALSDTQSLPAVQMADTAPAIGARVWIVAAPADGASSPWVGDGMVSANDAVVTSDTGPIAGGLLETDANAGHAAAGGALVDGSGRVAGIVLGRVDDGTTTYAVPIKLAGDVAQQLRANGWVAHGSLGLDGVDAAAGPTVVKITANGPAAHAGMRRRDVVESVNGHSVDSIDAVTALVRSAAPGAGIDLGVRRGNAEIKIHVVLGSTKG